MHHNTIIACKRADEASQERDTPAFHNPMSNTPVNIPSHGREGHRRLNESPNSNRDQAKCRHDCQTVMRHFVGIIQGSTHQSYRKSENQNKNHLSQ